MGKRATHRVLELAVGIPLLWVGGIGIVADIDTYRWIQEDPEHHWGLVGVGTMLGLLPFMAGCWLVVMAAIRMWLHAARKAP